MALVSGRFEAHPVLMVARALRGEKPQEPSGKMESLLARHHERLAREQAKHAEA